jgi:hypothetical protein
MRSPALVVRADWGAAEEERRLVGTQAEAFERPVLVSMAKAVPYRLTRSDRRCRSVAR